MAAYHAEFPCDLAKPSQMIAIPHVFAMGDNESHTFTALVYDSSDPECGLMAGSVSGVVVRPDGATVPLTGEKGAEVRTIRTADGQTVQATACTLTMIQGAFAYPGQIVIVIRLVDGESQTAVLVARGTVTRSLTDTTVDPGEIIPDITQLIAEAEQAAADAESALSQATNVVSYAAQTGKTDAEKAQARSNIDAVGTGDLVYPGTDAGAYRLVSICDGDATDPHTFADWRNESGVTPVDLSRYPASIFIMLNDGTFSVNGTRYHSVQIPTGKDIKKLTIQAGTGTTVLAFAKTRMPDNPQNGDSFLGYLCEGETGRRTVSANMTATFTVPEDCTYIVIDDEERYLPLKTVLTSSLAARIAALEGGNSLTSAAAAE